MGFFNNIIYILKGHDAQGEIAALKSKLELFEQKERKVLEEKDTAEVASRNLNDKLIAESKAKQEYLDKANRLENKNKELNKRNNELMSAKTEIEQKLKKSEKNVEILTIESKKNKEKIQELTEVNNRLHDELSKTKSSSVDSSTSKEENTAKETMGEPADRISENITDKHTDDAKEVSEENASDEAENEPAKDQQTENAVTDSKVGTPRDEQKAKSKVEEAIKLSEGEIKDFPEIFNDSRQNSVRKIRYVFDNNYNVINAKQFFDTSSPEDIAKVSRDLTNAYNDHRLLWYCPYCHQAVKIAHWKNSLFFIHAEKQGDCIWRNPSQDSKQQEKEELSSLEDKVLPLRPDDTKYQELKNRIYAALTTSKSQRFISDVRMDSPIHGVNDNKKWSRADISFNYKDKLWVIELQHKGQGTSYIAKKDEFYLTNGIQTLWVFGSDSDTSYEYMNSFNYKTTLFDSHRNVFVFDKQAQSETSALGELRLKCNWLDDNGEWHFNIKKDGINGETIGLNDLIIDEIHCKPYFNDNSQEDIEEGINISEQNNNLGTKDKININKKSKEGFVEDKDDNKDNGVICEITNAPKEKPKQENSTQQVENDEKKQEVEVKPFAINDLWGFRHGDIIQIGPIFTKRPRTTKNGYYQVNQNGNIGLVDKYGKKVVDWNGIIQCNDMDYDAIYGRILYNLNGKWGVADKEGKILIEPNYDEIRPWNYEVYKVKQHNLLGLCNIHNELVLDCKYSYIGELNENGKASVQKAHPFDHLHNVMGSVGIDGKPIITLSQEQPDGNIAIMQIGLWGLQDKYGKTIMPCQYDSIEYLAPDFYKVSVGDKWGIYKTDDGALLYKNEYNKLSVLKNGQVTILPNKSKENNTSTRDNVIQNAFNRPHGNKKKHEIQQIQVYGAVRKRIKYRGRVVQLVVALLDNGEHVVVSENSFISPIPKISSFHVGDKIHLIMKTDKRGHKYVSQVIK